MIGAARSKLGCKLCAAAMRQLFGMYPQAETRFPARQKNGWCLLDGEMGSSRHFAELGQVFPWAALERLPQQFPDTLRPGVSELLGKSMRFRRCSWYYFHMTVSAEVRQHLKVFFSSLPVPATAALGLYGGGPCERNCWNRPSILSRSRSIVVERSWAMLGAIPPPAAVISSQLLPGCGGRSLLLALRQDGRARSSTKSGKAIRSNRFHPEPDSVYLHRARAC